MSAGLREDAILDRSTATVAARSELLRQSVFPVWGDDVAGTPQLEDAEHMHQKDPLLTQVWKLYKRTKADLPNQERMENLSWRMMAMNLKRELERYVWYEGWG